MITITTIEAEEMGEKSGTTRKKKGKAGGSGNKMIRQPYPLTMARYDFNVPESRILLRIIEALQPNMAANIQLDLFDSNTTPVMLDIKNLMPEDSRNHHMVKAALKGLLKKVITIKGYDEKDGGFTRHTGIISGFDYYDNNRQVVVKIDNLVLPSFLELKNGYTRFALEGAFNSNSVYSMRMYQYISHWRDKTYKDENIDDLKQWLGCETKYSLASHFKSRVLDPAKAELKENQFSDIYFTYEDKKVGNKIVGFRFYIHTKKAVIELDDNTLQKRVDNIKAMLIEHFAFDAKQLRLIEHIIKVPENFEPIMHLMHRVKEFMVTNNSTPGKERINNKSSYMLQSIIKEFELS